MGEPQRQLIFWSPFDCFPDLCGNWFPFCPSRISSFSLCHSFPSLALFSTYSCIQPLQEEKAYTLPSLALWIFVSACHMDWGYVWKEENSSSVTNETKVLKGNAQKATRLFWDRPILPYFLILSFLDLLTLAIIYWVISMKKGDLAHSFSLPLLILPFPKFKDNVSILLLLLVFFLTLNSKTSIFCFITCREPFLSVHQDENISFLPFSLLLCHQGC